MGPGFDWPTPRMAAHRWPQRRYTGLKGPPTKAWRKPSTRWGSVMPGGDGMRRNAAKAIEWYRKAADQGMPQAYSAIGLVYAYGLDERMPKDPTKEFEGYLEAAERGRWTSQASVAQYLLEGKMVPRDLVEGLKWAIIANRSGRTSENVLKALGQIRMSGEDRAQDAFDPSSLGDIPRTARRLVAAVEFIHDGADLGSLLPGFLLHPSPDRRHRLVEPLLPILERAVAGRLVHQTGLDPRRCQALPQGLRAVSLVPVDRPLVALDQGACRRAVVQVGAGQDGLADQTRTLVHRHMCLLAEVALAVLLRPAGVRIALRDRALIHRRRLYRGLQQGGVDQRPLADDRATRVQLPVDLREQGLRQIVEWSGTPSSSGKPAKRRKDSQSSTASSRPGSDRPYHCWRSSSLTRERTGYEGLPSSLP